MTTKQAQDAMKKYGSANRAGRALHVHHSAICRALAKGEQAAASDTLLSVDAAIAPHDIVGSALKIVEAIPAGQVKPDIVVRRELNVSEERWRRARGSIRLSGFSYQMPDKAFVWGRKATITTLSARMKEIL
jgi:hypothetical protein